MSSSAEMPKATRREWIGLAVIALPCLLYAMDLTVLDLAVPQLAADLRPSSTQLLWIVDIYGFMVAGFLITMGTLGDRIGRRRLLLLGAGAFGLASVLAAYSTSAGMLILARALLGIGGATLAPSTLSLLRSMFHDPRQRTMAIGVWITSFSVGGAIGPLAGGALLEWFWWGSVFLLAVPVMVLLLVLGPILLPEYRDPDAGRLDLPSAVLSLGSVLLVIYGMKGIAQDGPGVVAVLSIVAGLGVGTAFVLRQRRLDDPLLDLRLFKVPALSAALTTNILAFFVAFGAFLFIPLYLQSVLDMSPLEAGLWTLPSGLGFIVGSSVTPPLVGRVRPAWLMAGGLALAAAGFGLITMISSESGLGFMVTGSVIFSLGLAPVFTLTTDLIVGAAPPERAGAASAVSETSSELGGALGIAVLGSVVTAVYRGKVEDAIPAGVSPDVAEAAQDTLGGATEVVRQLPGQAGVELLATAREAFTQGLQLTFTICAAGAVGIAILTAAMLRRVPVGGQPAERPEPADEVSCCAGKVAVVQVAAVTKE